MRLIFNPIPTMNKEAKEQYMETLRERYFKVIKKEKFSLHFGFCICVRPNFF